MNTQTRLKICSAGTILLKIFLISVTLFTAAAAVLLFAAGMPWQAWLAAVVAVAVIEFIVFWTGIILVYCSSVQLGIKIRIIGALVGMIPVANMAALIVIIKTVSQEVSFERQKLALNKARHHEQVCKTKYPLLMVHGVFFRDYRFLNYWGRIPRELTENGATVYFGNQESAASVAESGRQLAVRIRQIVQETGCGKVNVIAHSKGGLDIRYAAAFCGIEDMIGSIVTINTPHRGCKFAEYLLEKLPVQVQQKIASAYDGTMKKLGDQAPDFMAAVRDLTAGVCKDRDSRMPQPGGVWCMSVGSRLNKAAGGKFPLNFTYNLVKYFDGPNDGLVAESSFRWGDDYIFLETDGKRGISHGDMIDLNRENIPGFDVREFYVDLVSRMKKMGL